MVSFCLFRKRFSDFFHKTSLPLLSSILFSTILFLGPKNLAFSLLVPLKLSFYASSHYYLSASAPSWIILPLSEQSLHHSFGI